MLGGYSSVSELFRLPEWQKEATALVHGSFGERSPFGSRFPESMFPDVPETATEQVRTCGFRRKSSSLDKAPKIRDSARLNSFESFLVTLTSISSETWEIYSWGISGSSVSSDWLFLVFSGLSLETTANFRLILKVAMVLREKICQLWRLNLSSILYNKSVNLLIWRSERGFNEYKQLMISNPVQYRKVTIYIILILLSFFLLIPFLGGKRNCLHAKSRYN